MTMATASEGIAALNGAFRRTFAGGRVYLTSGVLALSGSEQADLLRQVQAFDSFNADNDPYGEHDFGSLQWGHQTYFWKIDYYDPSLSQHSPNSADASVTVRVITVMRADEY